MTNTMNSPENPYGSHRSHSHNEASDNARPGTGGQSTPRGDRGKASNPGFGTDIGNDAKTIWATRPVRLPREQNSDAWFFGVAEGIAVRYQVDPNLVRLFFAVLALTGGGGFLLYGLCMLLMPRYSVPLSPFETVLNNAQAPRYSNDKNIAWVLLVFMVISLASSSWLTEGWGLVGLAVGALLLWLLHQRQPEPPAVLQWHPYPGTPLASHFDATTGPVKTTATNGNPQLPAPPQFTPVEGFAPQEPTPPSWDPLGAAPFAWDLPDPDHVLGSDSVQADDPKAKKAKQAPKGKRILMGIVSVFLTIILVLTGMAAVGLIKGNRDSSVAMLGSTGTVHLNTKEKAQTTITISSTKILLDEVEVHRNSEHDVRLYASSVDLKIPHRTNGPSYRLKLNCRAVFGSTDSCDAARDVTVKGSDWSENLEKKRSELPELALNVSSTLSTLNVVKE